MSEQEARKAIKNLSYEEKLMLLEKLRAVFREREDAGTAEREPAAVCVGAAG